MKDTRRPKNAPPWGTLDWIAAFPHSKMDRKRRKRAERVVGDKTVKDIMGGPSARRLITEYERLVATFIMPKGGIGPVPVPRKTWNNMLKAGRALVEFETALRDEAFARELAKAWGIR